MICIFLQNAWSGYYAGDTWPRESWLWALANCRSGKMLKHLERAYGGEVWYDNTTPIVGATPSSVVPADPKHIRGVLRRCKPTAVVCCGRQAATAVMPLARVPVLCVPHPASRVLTIKLYEEAGRALKNGLTGWCELQQLRGSHRLVTH